MLKLSLWEQILLCLLIWMKPINFRAMQVQLLIITIFLLIPGQLFLCLLFLEVTWGSMITPLVTTTIHLHVLLESLKLLYFIKPYQNFVVTKLSSFKGWVAKTFDKTLVQGKRCVKISQSKPWTVMWKTRVFGWNLIILWKKRVSLSPLVPC